MVYNIPAHKSGDTWKGISGITIYRNGSALNLTNADVKMQVRFQIDAPVVVEFSTQNNTIQVFSPLSGIIVIPEQVIDIPPAKYQYDLKVTLPSGEVKTFLEGVWEITSHITRA